MTNLIKEISLLGILTYGSACHEFEGWNEVYPCNTDISLLIVNSRKMMEIYRLNIDQEIKKNFEWIGFKV